MPQDFEGVMHEWKEGKLHSGGSGKVVKSQKQAIAIGFSEDRKLHGGKKPAKKKKRAPAKRAPSRIATAMSRAY